MPMQPSPMRETTAPCEPSFIFFIVISSLDEPHASADSFFFRGLTVSAQFSNTQLMRPICLSQSHPAEWEAGDELPSGCYIVWPRHVFLLHGIRLGRWASGQLCGGCRGSNSRFVAAGHAHRGVVHHGGGFFRCDRFSI